jgi:hypothetical protein
MLADVLFLSKSKSLFVSALNPDFVIASFLYPGEFHARTLNMILLSIRCHFQTVGAIPCGCPLALSQINLKQSKILQNNTCSWEMWIAITLRGFP